MPGTKSSSSSPPSSADARGGDRLVRVPLDRLRRHPANANVMGEERLEKLAENIRREGEYPPLVVRPDPCEEGCYQILDGHQRADILRRLGHRKAICYVWPCDDQTALILLATLNRLEGQDDPLKRAELLRELSELVSPEELAQILPESAALIRQSLDLLNLDLEGLLADLERAAGGGSGLRAISFVVSADDESVIEEAVARAAEEIDGQNRRGRALAEICRSYLEVRNG